MILLLLICSSLLIPTMVSAASLSGRIVLESSKEKRVKSNRDYSGVVLWLESTTEPTSAKPVHVRMVQKEKAFIPHVLAVPVSSTVDFPNFDPIFHNAFSNFSGQVFDVGLYAPGTSRKVTFRRPGIVRVFCNIHPTMSAVIAVLPTLWFDVTSSDGSFRINSIPPGDYMLRVFHERATAAALSKVERKISVVDNEVLPPVAISESGYILFPHKNKYGKDYQPVIEDKLPYGGTHK